LVFGKPWADKQQQQQSTSNSSNSSSNIAEPSRKHHRRIAGSPTTNPGSSSSSSSGGTNNPVASQVRKPFVFISAFKWEMRKGWDVLLQAYLSEFTAEDDVELYILTKPFGDSGTGFKEKMSSWADKMRKDEAASKNTTSSSSSKPTTDDSAMALVKAAALGNYLLSPVPASAAVTWAEEAGAAALGPAAGSDSASSAQSPTAGEAGSKGSPARHLQGLTTQQQQQDTAGQKSKAFAQYITQQIRQFTLRNITVPASEHQRRMLLQDSQPAPAAAAAASPHLNTTEAQQYAQQDEAQQQGVVESAANAAAAAAAASAAAAAAAAARYPTLYVVDSHISGGRCSHCITKSEGT
jgi:hypothetical protein